MGIFGRVLEPGEQRILGSLLEKESTVPGSYLLTANALRAACNQTSSREPVVEYDEQIVTRTARALKERGLLRIVWSDTGRRTLKYHQILDEQLELEPDERALLTVLLRGAQTPGEMRTRTERLHPFADRGQVEGCLHRMAGRAQPPVRELERQPGHQDRRWVHLFGPARQETRSAVAAVDRDAVITGGADARDIRVRSSYDAVAPAYADHLADELRGLAFETWLLDRVLAHADGNPVVEVGLGPGHVTAYLADRGADATGIELSPSMVSEARRRFPGRSFGVGDLRRLGRPLAPGGWLVLALHAGTGVRHLGEWFGHEVDLDFVLHEPASVVGVVETAGLADVEWYLRGPVTTRGETTQRLYIIGRNPT